MFGGDLPSNDDFTLSLLTNREVLKMHREGTDVRQLFQEDGRLAVTSRNAKTGDIYLALFNISDKEEPIEVTVNIGDIDVDQGANIINLWTGENLGKVDSAVFGKKLDKHASVLVKFSN
jgi:hypothetical protein